MLENGLFSRPKALKAANGVFFSIEKGRTMGLVGESGYGKTTMNCIIPELYQATVNRVLYQETGIIGLGDNQMTPYRKKMQTIFQDPYTSLDSRKNIGDIITEPIWAIELHMGKDRNDRARELVEMIGLRPDHTNRYPRELSGGQKQKIDIVRVLIAEPEFVVCDEPISTLDVFIQVQVISILKELQDKFHFTYLLISHDLSTIRHISLEVGVTYLGNLIEHAQVDELYDNMLHPHTQSLISAVPVVGPKLAKENKGIILEGDVPSPINPAPGCPFRGRCRYAKDICSQTEPELKAVNDKHEMAYHLFDWANGARLIRAEAWDQKHGTRSV